MTADFISLADSIVAVMSVRGFGGKPAIRLKVDPAAAGATCLQKLNRS